MIDGEQLRDSGAKSLSAAIRTSASVSDFYNTLYVENLMVRGFLLDNILNFRRDGLPTSNYMPIAFENKERIEVLNGVSGVVAGTSSPGGLVNYALKRPTAAPLREVFVELAERGTVTAAADFGGRAADGRLGYRVNAALQERRPMSYDADGDKVFGSGYVDLRLPGGWLIESDLELQRVRQISVPGLGLLDSDGDGVAETLPPPLDPKLNLNNQPWSLPVETNSAIATLGASKQLGERTRVGVRALVQRIRTDDRLAFPDGCSTGPNYVYPGLCGNYDVDIYDFRSEDERRNVNVLDATAEHALDTAGFGLHQLKGGLRQTKYYERLPALQAYNFAGTINALAPTALPPAPDPATPNTNRDMRLREAYVYDAAQFGPHWRAWLGVRRSQLDRSSALSDGSEAVSLSQSFTTPWGALGWQSGGTFVYGSAGSGVEIETVPNRPDIFSNPGAVLPALRSRQAEIGIKQSYGKRWPRDPGAVPDREAIGRRRAAGRRARRARVGSQGTAAPRHRSVLHRPHRAERRRRRLAHVARRRDHEVGGSGAHRQAADQRRAVRRGAAHGVAPAHEPGLHAAQRRQLRRAQGGDARQQRRAAVVLAMGRRTDARGRRARCLRAALRHRQRHGPPLLARGADAVLGRDLHLPRAAAHVPAVGHSAAVGSRNRAIARRARGARRRSPPAAAPRRTPNDRARRSARRAAALRHRRARMTGTMRTPKRCASAASVVRSAPRSTNCRRLVMSTSRITTPLASTPSATRGAR